VLDRISEVGNLRTRHAPKSLNRNQREQCGRIQKRGSQKHQRQEGDDGIGERNSERIERRQDDQPHRPSAHLPRRKTRILNQQRKEKRLAQPPKEQKRESNNRRQAKRGLRAREPKHHAEHNDCQRAQIEQRDQVAALEMQANAAQELGTRLDLELKRIAQTFAHGVIQSCQRGRDRDDQQREHQPPHAYPDEIQNTAVTLLETQQQYLIRSRAVLLHKSVA